MTTTFDNNMGDDEKLDFLMALVMMLVARNGGVHYYTEAELRRFQSGEEYTGLRFVEKQFTVAGQPRDQVAVILEKRETITINVSPEPAGLDERVALIRAVDFSDPEVQRIGRKVLRAADEAMARAFENVQYSGQDRDSLPITAGVKTCIHCGKPCPADVIDCTTCGETFNAD